MFRSKSSLIVLVIIVSLAALSLSLSEQVAKEGSSQADLSQNIPDPTITNPRTSKGEKTLQVDFSQRIPDLVSSLPNQSDNTRPRAITFDDLQVIAQEEGTVQVIVELNLSKPYQPEGRLSEPDQLKQRAAIAEAQQNIHAAMDGTLTVVNNQYETLPYIAMEVDERALTKLFHLPYILAVREDSELTMALDDSASVVGTDVVWESGYTGVGQTIAILDTGIDASHSFFGDRVVEEACFSYNLCPNGETSQIGPGASSPSDPQCFINGVNACAHGSHVAGIAAGSNQNFSGIAPDANIISVQVFSQIYCTESYLATPASNVIKGLEYVYQLRDKYDISSINLSLTNGMGGGICDGLWPEWNAMFEAMVEAGIAPIAAAGNQGLDWALSYPACSSKVISVGATTNNDVVASFSNRNRYLDLFAPGVGITSSVPGGNYTSMSGTSMSAAFVSGAFAILRQAAPSASVEEILTVLKETGILIPINYNMNGYTTIPRIQLDAALERLTGTTPTITPTEIPNTPTQVSTETPTETPVIPTQVPTQAPTEAPKETPIVDATIDGLLEALQDAWENDEIKNKGTYENMQQYLLHAKHHLENDDNEKALQSLQQFIEQLDRQAGKHITQEADDYLKKLALNLIAQIEG